MIVVANRIAVAPGYEDQFEASFGGGQGLTEQPGFIRNLLLRPLQGGTYVVMTFWDSRAAFEQWTQSDHFRQSHRGNLPPDAFLGRPTLEIHEVIRDTEDPALRGVAQTF